tara:strand:- start:1880 stop:3178 length:1299 start_codon:yes stop_codon:yes gene_type:complete
VKNKGIKLFREAKKIIPGGTMLYSKKPELHSPNFWPTYFTKAKDCYVWDTSNKKFLDMVFLVGTNTLGYAKKEIDNQVIKHLKRGNMTSLNCTEEIKLAKLLLNIHPWAHQARFTRGGGEANSAIIRIARASTKKHNIAFCGYHGWHDWYLSSNLNNKKNLDMHLMSNLKFNGVDKSLKNSSFPFLYNDLKGFNQLVKKKNIGIVIMEVTRNIPPKNNFLKKIRKICNQKKIILIFDECTSGFRENFGGKHLDFKIYPDLAMFGKAIGNGYAINAIIGKKKFMKNTNKTFISSTFWTERIGSVAGVSTINFMKKYRTYSIVKKQGQKIKSKWKYLSKKYGLNIKISSLDSIPIFTFGENHNLKKTFLTNEFLKNKILASNIIYVSISHTDKILKIYFEKLEEIFKKISIMTTKQLKEKVLNGKVYNPMRRIN